MKHAINISILFILCTLPALAQQEYSDIRKGNRHYKKENYTEAEVNYRRALEKNEHSFESHYNLGDALFNQEKYPEAAEQFAMAANQLDQKKDKKRLAETYHNLGNSLFGAQQYDKAVQAYQQSLRHNPKDNDTRYNLVKAMQMMQQQQQNQDQNQQQQQQQQQQEQNQNQDQQQQQQEQQQQNQDQMDKETAEQILQALEQDEQDTQEKLQRQKGSKKRAEKDW